MQQPQLEFNGSSSNGVYDTAKHEQITGSYDGEQQNPNRPNDQQGLYRLPFGWTPLLFGVVTALVAALLAGAVVGGAVGGSLAGSGSKT